MTDRCYCIFEGGGAKGIAHVGALAALEESGLDLCGFAGTSAGAVIAALAAAGYKSSDLIAPDKDRTILDLIDLDPSNIWFGEPMKPAGKPSRLFGWYGWVGILAARAGGVYILLAAVLGILLVPTVLIGLSIVPVQWIILLQAASLICVVVLASIVASGLASLTAFERGLNQLLRLKIAAQIDPATAHRARLDEPVTFEDLAKAKCPPLRVVAADISARQLQLFSVATTPKAGVASAVAASVCLPVIFRPWSIGSRLYLDGGLVSNLPAWAFDAERALDRDAWTAVVQVGDTPKEERLRGIGILKGAVLTGIFGSGLLNVRNVDRLKAVRLKVDLQLLQFDPGIALARKVVEESRQTCIEELVFHLRDVPQLMTDVCWRIQSSSEEMLNLALTTQDKPKFCGRLRVSCYVRAPDDPSSMIAEFQSGFEDFADERLRVPVRGSIAGHALATQEPLYLERRDAVWTKYLARPQERWLRKSVWPDIKWTLCIPYVHPADGIEMVVAIDSDTYLEVEDDLVDVALVSISDAVVLMLYEYLPKEAFTSGRS